jgi:peptidoglycan/LPS O-acetylase OafA/YrhL
VKKSNIQIYDILRDIAILCIIFAHIGGYTNLNFFTKNADYFARIGLIIFFFISGFLVQYNNKINSKKDIILSIKKRAKRVYPLFWVSILLTIILDRLNLNIHPSDMNIYDLLISALGLQGLFPMFKVPYALWYIEVILIFYMVSYFLIYYARDLKQIIVYSIVIFFSFFVVKYEFGIIYINVLVYYFIFIAGFTIGFICNSKNVSNEKIKSISISSLFFICSLYVVYRLTCSMMNAYYMNESGMIDKSAIISAINSNDFKFVLIYDIFIFFVLVILGIIIYKKSSFTPNFDRFSSKEIFLKMAYSSYAVYLFHIQILSLIKKALDVILVEGVITDYLILILGIPILFILGYQIQKYLDRYTTA